MQLLIQDVCKYVLKLHQSSILLAHVENPKCDTNSRMIIGSQEGVTRTHYCRSRHARYTLANAEVPRCLSCHLLLVCPLPQSWSWDRLLHFGHQCCMFSRLMLCSNVTVKLEDLKKEKKRKKTWKQSSPRSVMKHFCLSTNTLCSDFVPSFTPLPPHLCLARSISSMCQTLIACVINTTILSSLIQFQICLNIRFPNPNPNQSLASVVWWKG